MIAARFIKAGDEVRGARPCRAATHPEPAGQLCLSGSRKRPAFLVAYTNPLDAAAANAISQWIKRVAD
jgi:hypothetical protein